MTANRSSIVFAESSTDSPDRAVELDPATPCLHCGLPVGRYPVGAFCCSACETVYSLLHEAGMADTYYRLKHVAARRDASPANVALDQQLGDQLDSERFLAEHTSLTERGRCAELYLDGVHCAACVWLVERMPLELAGVQEARLDLARSRLSISWDPDNVQLSSIADWLARFGYAPQPLASGEDKAESRAERRLLIRMGIAWSLAANVMLIALAFYAGLDRNSPDLYDAGRWMSLLLAIPSLFYAGQTFFRRASASIQRAFRTRSLRALDMDTPIALGLLVGFADSVRSTVLGSGEVWFDSLTVLVAALLTARWLQLRSRRLAGDASDRLLSLVPATVRVRTDDGSFETVPADEVGAESIVRIEAGETLAVDGEILEGQTQLDKAVLTGETRPEAAGPGTLVEAGSTNLTQPILVRVHSAGANTRVGQLLSWVRDASKHRAPVVQLADRLSGFFVATVLLLALATFVFWIVRDSSVAVANVVALLVISCPCALGMATPLAMAVAIGRAARSGVFIKAEAALEQLTQADMLILDKTGTLTSGKPTVIEQIGTSDAIRLAATLERGQNHPVAEAIRFAAPPLRQPVSSLYHEPGFGIEGFVGARWVQVGQPKWVQGRLEPVSRVRGEADALVSISEEAEILVARIVENGRSPVLVAADGAVVAVLGLGDAVRPEASEVVERFLKSGRRVGVFSGDHTEVVRRVATEVGIDLQQVQGRMSPEDKRAAVERLQEQGRRIIMVGDGVNDAAALVQADVGIAVEGGTTASLVAADIFLTESGLRPVLQLIDGGRHVMQVIRRNLGISLLYNAIGAGAAVAGLVSPLVAAVAMPISSLFVVASSILQRSFQQPAAAQRP